MRLTHRSWATLTVGSLCSAFFLSYLILYCLSFYSLNKLDVADNGNYDASAELTGINFMDTGDWEAYASDRIKDDDESTFANTDSPCTMETCFDFSRCTDDFKVYVYPPTQSAISPTYNKILNSIYRSNLWTKDPEKACIFIPSLDTLDRDPLSPQFGHRIAYELTSLPYWNQLPEARSDEQLKADGDAQRTLSPHQPGRNHLVFNLYAGTWPNYHEDEYRLSLGQAMLAKASFSTTRFRPNFDISLPLIHPEHTETERNASESAGPFSSSRLRAEVRRPILLSFKGKRYLSGVGSTSRNALFHLHNGDDIIMLTTCRHGTDWVRHADHRCAVDMELYDKYDYNMLMQNSTFCLVSRGRRLASYRFLEVLQASCIPVMLSDDWELPFSEVIDWRRAVVWGDERLLLTLPLTLRRLNDFQIVQLRQQVAFLWNTYFRSVESIVLTTLEIIRDRVALHRRSSAIWNSPPGALVLSQRHSTHTCQVPLEQKSDYCDDELVNGFTMLIPIRGKVCSDYEGRMQKFASTVFQSHLLRKILIVWLCHGQPPSPAQFRQYFSIQPELIVPDEMRMLLSGKQHSPSPAIRFQPFFEIPTLAVFTFTMELDISGEEVEFGFRAWREFPNRLVGYQPASHRLNASSGLWEYVMDPNNKNFSIVLLDAAFYHRHYNYLYWLVVDSKLHEIIGLLNDCEDLLLNALIGHISQAPPVLIDLVNENKAGVLYSKSLNTTYIVQRSACLQAFAERFSTTPSRFWSPPGSVASLGVIQNRTKNAAYMPLYYASYSFRSTVDLNAFS